jgi:TUG ubiquitin-like domain
LLADQRRTVNVSPMAPLSAVVEAALSAEGVHNAKLSACKLLLGKTELDLSSPLRFANLPTGAKLQLITGAVSRSPQQVLISCEL